MRLLFRRRAGLVWCFLLVVMVSLQPAAPHVAAQSNDVGDVFVATSDGISFVASGARWSDYFCVRNEICLTGDFNGDGRDDVVAFVRTNHGFNDSDVYVGLSTGSAFSPAQKWADYFCTLQETCAVGDFNGDGRDDIAAFVRTNHGVNDSDVWVALSTGTAFSAPQKWADYFCTLQEICAVGDFNGDGMADIAAFVRTNHGVNDSDVWVALSTGSAFGTGAKWADYFCTLQEICAVGDFNGDGMADIAAFVRTNHGVNDSDVWIALSTGSAFGAGAKWADYFCTLQEICAVGDFNGDGRADVAAFVRTNHAANDSDVWIGLSMGSAFGTPQKWQEYFCTVQEICAVGNFNGDGRADIAAFVRSPLINMRITRILVNQGVQSFGFGSTGVPLIRNRRTFARVHVESDGPPVPGVTARLYGSWNGDRESGGPLVPINLAGAAITVQSRPDNNNIDHHFVFELPWQWTTKTDLNLRAELNPTRDPPQADYSRNSLVAGRYNFVESPRLVVQFVAFGYELNNVTYYPNPITQVPPIYSLVRRMFPVASSSGGIADPTPGFRPNYWIMFDDGLASRVNWSSTDCTDLLTLNPDGSVANDNRVACSTRYANGRLAAIRTAEGLPADRLMYGLVRSAPGFGVRGWASGTLTASGDPAGDFTAVHEIGHMLGRLHPQAGSSLDTNACGNTPADGGIDPSYPYRNSAIGPNDATVLGIDPGDDGLSPRVPVQLKPASQWFDIMGYCGPQWISDYTYNALFASMIANPPDQRQVAPGGAGDWLLVFGAITADGEKAIVSDLRRLPSVGTVPDRVAGPYSIRLLNAVGATVGDYPFTPDDGHDVDGAGALFGQVVPFMAGTSRVRIVRLADNRILLDRPVSSRPPTISAVTVDGATEPVTGSVTLTWTAGDPDGDALHFDVYASRDGGETWQPLRLGLSETRVTLDSAQLEGSSVTPRVVASDGVQTASAIGEPFMLAARPPVPVIHTPGDGTSLEAGQLLNLSGEAIDPQDGTIADARLVWSAGTRSLGIGRLHSVSDLAVGQHRVTLTATNSRGLSASTSVSITVRPALSLPPPTLSVGPSELAWHIAPGTTATQRTTVSLSNSGGGVLTWTAETDAEWLTLSAVQGATPVMLTVTADPSDMLTGTRRQGNVIITASGGLGRPDQRVLIPVSLSMGSVQEPPAEQQWAMYLPLLRR